MKLLRSLFIHVFLFHIKYIYSFILYFLAANERQLTLNAQALPHNDSSTAQNNIQPPPYSSTVPAATNQIAMQSNATNQNSSHIPVETNQVLPSENTVA